LPRLEINSTKGLDFSGFVHSIGIKLALDLVHSCRVDRFADLRALEISFESVANFIWVVDKIKDESVFFQRVDTIQPRKRLNGLDARESTVDIHRVQKGLIKISLILFGDQQYLILLRRKNLRQLLFTNPQIHAFLSVGHVLKFVVNHYTREGDQ
jgi:hypothetical protein